MRDFKYIYVCERSQLSKVLPKIDKGDYLFLDTETTADKVRLIQVGNEEEIFVIDLFEVPEAVEPLREIIASKGIVGHNLKFDLKFLYPIGIRPTATFDTMIGSYLLGFERHSLSHIAQALADISLDKTYQLSDWKAGTLSEAQIRYAAMDVLAVREVFYKMREKLNELPKTDRGQDLLKTKTARIFGLTSPVAIIEMAFVQEVAKIELAGTPVDVQEIDRLLKELERKRQRLVMDFMSRYRVDPLSPKQVGKFLKDRVGLDLPKTEKGNISTDDKTLSEFAHIREVSQILEIRHIKKIIDKIQEIKEHAKNGRVYPEFRQIGAVTGRMSSSHPNVQNIPRDLRSLFKAQEGNLLVVADFSQIELRIASEYVGDKNMIKAFKEGKDLHKYTASLVLEKPEEEISKEERQLAKAMNFGLIYGISAKGLSAYAKSSYGVDLSVDQAQVLRSKFFRYFSAFERWHEKVKRILKDKGEIKGHTLIGRPYRAETFTDAVNYPIQGTGADMLKLAVLMLGVELKKRGLSGKVVNLVHDEIVVECPSEEAHETKEALEKAMKSAGSMVLKEVPVEVEANVSERWEKE